MLNENIQISVIVLFYHGESWIQNCIHSLESQSLDRSKYELILVNNGGSTPSVAEYSEHPNIKVLHFSKNWGFAGGNNKAHQHAEGDLILLMNQDVVVHFDCLKELICAFKRYPEAGCISANMMMTSKKQNINQQGPIQNTVGYYRLTHLGYALYSTIDKPKTIVPVEFVSGNALCFRKRILKDAGNYLFDESLISYAEDLDLSIRLKQTEWEMYVCPNAVVYHYRDDAFSGSYVKRLIKLLHVSANRLMVYYKNFSQSKFIKKLPALLLGIPFKVLQPDGAPKKKPFHFFVAFGFLPVILVLFGFKVIQSSTTKEKN